MEDRQQQPDEIRHRRDRRRIRRYQWGCWSRERRAQTFPYIRGSRICKQRLIGSSVLEAKPSFRRLKCREALSWLCLLIPPAISHGFLWERLTNDDPNDSMSRTS